MVMKSKLQFDRPISRAVAKAGSEKEKKTNRDAVEDWLGFHRLTN